MATAAQAGKGRLSGRKMNGRKPSPERWEEWVAHLGNRSTPALSDLLPVAERACLLWALPQEFKGTATEELIMRLSRLSAKTRAAAARTATELEKWLDTLDARTAEPALGLEAIAWSHALPTLSQVLPTAPWCQLLEVLIEVATEASKVRAASSPLADQLLTGELPLTLAYLFPELSDCKSLASAARKSLSSGLVELLDGEGLVHANNWEILRPLLACWTRCGLMGRTMRPLAFTSEAKTQYDWLVLQALRLCRPDGSQVLSHDAANAWCPGLFAAALELGGDEADRHIASAILPGKKAATAANKKLPEPAAHSEWATAAVLRRAWSRDSDQLAIAYSNSQLRLELTAAGQTVFSGPGNPEIDIDGERLPFAQDWEEVCWLTDSDLDYLELEIKLGRGFKLQRQMLLAREDRFLFMADALLGNGTAQIDYRSVLPLADGISFRPESETHDGMLVGRKRLGAVLPLQLPEWRSEREPGSLSQVSAGLELRQSIRGQRMLAPILIDLEPKRVGKPLTWRRLTVAQLLETVPADIAVGYRVQLANRQWLIYRSLAPVANRTLLGQNVCNEFTLGRFTEAGETESLIEIE